MARNCEGCRVEVQVDWRTGRTSAADGSTGMAMFNDPMLVVWACPVCDYPHADEVARSA